MRRRAKGGLRGEGSSQARHAVREQLGSFMRIFGRAGCACLAQADTEVGYEGTRRDKEQLSDEVAELSTSLCFFHSLKSIADCLCRQSPFETTSC